MVCAHGPGKTRRCARKWSINRLKRKAGALTLDLDILRETARLRPATPENAGSFSNVWATRRPRVQGRRSRAQQSNERWAMDLTQVPCRADGSGASDAVIDGHGCEVTGFEFALRGRAKEAERALEEACLARFGTLVP
jgi:transposase InsO family protein